MTREKSEKSNQPLFRPAKGTPIKRAPPRTAKSATSFRRRGSAGCGTGVFLSTGSRTEPLCMVLPQIDTPAYIGGKGLTLGVRRVIGLFGQALTGSHGFRLNY